jgi:phosphoribosylanthranilate isomerase
VRRTRVKICGITRPEDAIAAAEAGADAVGIVLYSKVKRYVPPELAAKIIAVLPPFATPVGLFVDSSPDEVRQIARSLNLRHIQLHGHESPADVRALDGFAVIKAMRVSPNLRNELDQWRKADLPSLRGFVLETDTKAVGGTGVENDWSAIAALLNEGVFAGLPPIIAAGGLRPQNVAHVIRTIHPYAVDVSSGVENEPGKKSAELMRSFVAGVRMAE